MQGLKEAKELYLSHGAEMIHRLFPEYEGRIAVGLVAVVAAADWACRGDFLAQLCAGADVETLGCQSRLSGCYGRLYAGASPLVQPDADSCSNGLWGRVGWSLSPLPRPLYRNLAVACVVGCGRVCLVPDYVVPPCTKKTPAIRRRFLFLLMLVISQTLARVLRRV